MPGLLVANILLLGLFGPALAPTNPGDSPNNGSDEQVVVVDNGGTEQEGANGADEAALTDGTAGLPSPLVVADLTNSAGNSDPFSSAVESFDTSTTQFIALGDDSGAGGSGSGGGTEGGGSGGGNPIIASFGGGGGLGGPGGGGGGGGGAGGSGEPGDSNNPSGPSAELLNLDDETFGSASVPEPSVVLLLCAAALGLLTYPVIRRRASLAARPITRR